MFIPEASRSGVGWTSLHRAEPWSTTARDSRSDNPGGFWWGGSCPGNEREKGSPAHFQTAESSSPGRRGIPSHPTPGRHPHPTALTLPESRRAGLQEQILPQLRVEKDFLVGTE